MQETRHSGDRVAWATRCAADRGWRIRFSTPPQGHGGTAIAWRRALGRSSADDPPAAGHRSVTQRWAGLTVTSAYGPASGTDVAWFTAVTDPVARAADAACVLGDLNWKRPYDDHARVLTTASPQPTTAAGTSPTRMLANRPTRHVTTVPLPGIPFHHLVVYSLHGRPAPAPTDAAPVGTPLRPRRVARYAWVATAVLHADHPIEAEVDRQAALLPVGAPLADRWARWHRRTEVRFRRAVHEGMARCEHPPERPKGNVPELLRPAALGPAHRAPTTVAGRRLRRVHRGLVERTRQGAHLDAPLPAGDARKIGRLHMEGIVPAMPASLADAMECVSAAVAAEDRRASQERGAAWRRCFADHTAVPWRAARGLLRPTPPVEYTAADMRRQWEPIWRPEEADPDPAEWEAYADADGFVRPPSPTVPTPTLEAFSEALRRARGAAGWDGWGSDEVRAMANHMPRAVAELHALWCDTTHAAGDVGAGPPGATTEVVRCLYACRTVGVPKTADEARPISVISVLARAWNQAIQRALPDPPPGQWAGRKGTSVATATAHWLATPAERGAELDLKKAFDSVPHSLARRAALRAGLPGPVVALLAASWTADRTCVVRHTVSDPVRPTRGLPQGDPLSPSLLAWVLRPWGRAVAAAAPEASVWLYADDRTITVPRGHAPQLDQALAATARFDLAAGLTENAGKRQTWGPEKPAVEHLGTMVQPARPAGPRRPKDDYARAHGVLDGLARAPGGIAVRARLAAAFVRPHFTWCAPLHDAPSAGTVERAFRAIVRPTATWWCRRRFWADNVALHPQYAAAAAGLRAVGPLCHEGGHLRRAVVAHLRRFGLALVAVDVHRGVLAALPPSAGPELRRLAARAAQPAAGLVPGPGHFWCAAEAGQHLLRHLARRRLLDGIPATRRDREGHDRVCIEAQSAGPWTEWRRKLPTPDANALAVWRAGATRTPTRLCHTDGGPGASTTCPFCTHPHASTRHWWAECPRFANDRANLAAAHGIDAGWWHRQPRVTSKTGWVTYDAAPTVRRRSRCQVAAATLALRVLAATAVC